MDRRPKKYGALAEMLGVEYCRGIRRDGTYCSAYANHALGSVTNDGVVHWADRIMRWNGLVHFLKLVVIARDPDIMQAEPWRRVYLTNMALKKVAKEAHTRIPGRYLRADKAFVRASVANVGNDVPLRREAYEWSRKESGQTWT